MSDLAYILSPSFSGSTLLTFLLAAHPDIATVGELKASALGDIDEYDCSCGVRIKECPFWKAVSAQLARRGVTLNMDRFGTHFRCACRPLLDRVLRASVRPAPLEMARRFALYVLPGARCELRRIIVMNEAIIDVVIRAQDGRLFLDGSKDPIRLKYLYGSGVWNIRAIYLMRDGRGTAQSFRRHYGMSMAEAAGEWQKNIRECERVLRSLPKGSSITVRYEDLCRDPAGTSRRLFEFLGLDPERAQKDFRSIQYHIIGNAMRLNFRSEIKLDEKWKSGLSETDLGIFERTAGRLNRSYGYA